MVSMFGGSGQPADGLFIIPFHLLAVEIQLAKLVFCIIIALFNGQPEQMNCFWNIFEAFLGQPDFSGVVGGVGILFFCGIFQIEERLSDVLRNYLTAIQ